MQTLQWMVSVAVPFQLGFGLRL